jgi:DNA-binding MarR family transcriptional regulator
MEEYVFGSILLLANKMQVWGNGILDDLTMKQWFLLVLISKMGKKNPTIMEIADFTGTSRQNAKKLLEQMEKKGYVSIKSSKTDARALNVALLKKAYKYFEDNDDKSTEVVNDFFSEITDSELCITKQTLEKLLFFFGITPLELNGGNYE